MQRLGSLPALSLCCMSGASLCEDLHLDSGMTGTAYFLAWAALLTWAALLRSMHAHFNADG